jgi:arylsulfatase A-like enzyme
MIKAGTIVGELCQMNDIVPTILELIDGKEPKEDWYDGISFLPLFLTKEKKRPYTRDNLFIEISYSKAVVTKDFKYIANRPPAMVLEILKQDEINSQQKGVKRQIGWDGINWNWNGVVYNNHRDFPCYFDSDQLYDLRKDVFEQHNLAYKPEYLSVLNEMKEKLKEQMRDYPYKFGEFAR